MTTPSLYDLRVHHDEVVMPLLSHWGIFTLEGLTPAAEQRRTELATFLNELDTSAARFEARRSAGRERDRRVG